MADNRDQMTWVVLELSQLGETKAADGTLTKTLVKDLGVTDDFPVFVPYANYLSGGRKISVCLMEGYSFVGSGLPETKYFSLESKPSVHKVLSSMGRHGVRVLQTVKNSKIEELRHKLSEITNAGVEVDSIVDITGGTYAGLTGRVIDACDDKVSVLVTLRSITIITSIPRSSIETTNKDHIPEVDQIPEVVIQAIGDYKEDEVYSSDWAEEFEKFEHWGSMGVDTVYTDPDKDDIKMLSKVELSFSMIPPIEADLIDLYFFRHLKQTDMADIFGVSQPTVCYRLQRAIQRIKYLIQLPKVDLETLRLDMEKFLNDPIDISIMVYMYETTCQSESAKRLNVSQGLVRHRFIRTVNKMYQDPDMHFYANMFSYVAENLNMLREVKRPVPIARSGYVLDC